MHVLIMKEMLLVGGEIVVRIYLVLTIFFTTCCLQFTLFNIKRVDIFNVYIITPRPAHM